MDPLVIIIINHRDKEEDEDPYEDKGAPVIVAVHQGASEEVKPRYRRHHWYRVVTITHLGEVDTVILTGSRIKTYIHTDYC